MQPPPLKNAAEYAAQTLALMSRKASVVKIHDGAFQIDLGDMSPYEIGLSSIKTERDILEGIIHLCPRNGVDLVTIEVVAKEMLKYLDSKTAKCR